MLTLVTVTDGGGIIFSGTLSNGSTFTITSSNPGQPFVGGQVTLTETLIGNTIINTTCGSPVFAGSVFGNFTVTSGQSLSGGTICCQTTETTPPVISGCPSNINVSSSNASCGASVNWTVPTVSDNCGVLSFTSSHTPGSVFPVGTTTVSYLATDNYGNTASCSFNVTVSDNTNPTFSGCPSNINLNTNASCQATATWTPPTASDNCSVSNVTSTHSPGATFLLGTTTVTYTATDAAGNVGTCSFNVIVSDNVNPTISGCPSNINVNANASCQAVVNWTAPTASDNCSIASFTSTHSPGATFSLGTTTVTYMATDGSGNVSTCSFNVIVTDNTNPVITGCPSTINLNANASCQAVANWTIPSVSDNCSISSFTSTHNPGATFPLGTTTVTYTATDGSGNIATCSFNVVVSDNTNPVITGCPSNINVSANASCQAVVNWTAPTASDNCSVASFTNTRSPGSTFSIGTTTVTYTATDGAGNVATCSFNVTVTDNINPVITACPSNINVSANASCQAVVNWTAPTASDNCSVASFTSTRSPGSTFSIGTTTVTYTATDGAGNVATCSFNVTVTDNTNPVIMGCPSNINVSANASCQAVVNWTAPTASDNCTVASFTSTRASGSTFSLGTTTVTYTATDAAGNVSTCSFNVTVSDNTNPVINNCPANINVNANASCQAVANWTPPTATDNCSVVLTSTHTPGSTFSLGTTTVTYTATDGSGNTSTCSFNVVVVDNTKPVITGCPTTITLNANASCQAVANWTVPSVSDNCSIASFSSTHNPGATFPLGTTTVTYTATDGAGNIATCSFDVVVSDNTNPQISNCPATINVVANSSCQATATWTAPTATDNCSVALTSSHNSGATFPIGTTTVTYTATDGAGNTTTCSFNVIVRDNTAPAISNCPASIVVDANADQCGASVSWTVPTASDQCSGSVTVSASHNPGDFFAVGPPTTVTYTFSDAAGNNAVCSFTVTVNDITAPQFQNCPQNIIITVNDACEAVATWTEPTASDNCTVAGVTSSHRPGDTFPAGTTEVTYEAIDNAGNKASCKFLVTVRTEDVPVITGCPTNITATAGESGKVAVFWEPPTASSRCGAVELVGSHEPGTLFPVGTTKVTYSIVNDATSVVQCSFNVTVDYEELVIEVVNVVTPNGDNVNDALLIPNIEKFKDNRVTIVDRWGSVLYQTTGYNNGSVSWKGTNGSGTIVPTGTYFYIIEVTFRGKRIEKRGFIELIQ